MSRDYFEQNIIAWIKKRINLKATITEMYPRIPVASAELNFWNRCSRVCGIDISWVEV